MDDQWQPVALATREVAAGLDNLVEESVRALREQVSPYSDVDEESLAPVLRRNFAVGLAAAGERRSYTPEELDAVASTIAARARQGISLDAVLHSFSIAEEIGWRALKEAARKRGATPETLTEAAELRTTIFSDLIRGLARVHREIELTLTAEAQQRLSASIRSLLEGRLSSGEHADHVRHLGLESRREHWVVRLRPHLGKVDAATLARRLQAIAPRAPVTSWGDDIVAIISEAPPAGWTDVTGGVAGPLPLGSAHQGFLEATRACETAVAFNLPGIHTVRELGLHTLVVAEPAFTDLLRDKYVTPLAGAGGIAEELLETVRVYLACGGRRESAAKMLHLHTNTVGYRVGRFEHFTGADLDDLQTLAELWWLFSASAVRR